MTDETPRPESAAPARHGGAGSFAVALIVALLILEFVVPGYILGLYTRYTGKYVDDTFMEVIFHPAYMILDRYPGIAHFYEWEYELAGGKP